ncbi:MAG TPA: hypothetical protein H9827_12245 [Candidatus Luteimonas excrementigallinarum]|nr:hypothetical protein [Candidatus Luteimonas excrementigallinarum]
MSTLERRHIPRTTLSALAAGAVLGALGYLAAGPPGLVVGVVIGVAGGALVGHRMAVSGDPDDNVGHFQEIHSKMEYYVPDMEWRDYEPAYRFGVETWRSRGGQAFEDIEPALGARWLKIRGQSRLTWDQARGPVQHAWRDMQETRQNQQQAG